MKASVIWRWPVRAVHWLFVVLVTAQVVTGDVLDDAMDWHMRIGYVLLTLVLFRIAWGFLGDRHARFTDFVRSPADALRYGKAMAAGRAEPAVGHNPLGGWAVVALLGVLLMQAVSGLFASDDVFAEGPLFAHASESLASTMLVIHGYGGSILLTLVALHIAAITYHRLRLGERLVGPMLSGIKRGLPDSYAPAPARPAWLAPLLIIVLAAAVTALVLVAQATAPVSSFY